MAVSKKLVKYLDSSKVKYEIIEHRIVYTAHDKAATLRVPEKIIGKTLAVKFARDYGLVLIPADKNLDKAKLKKLVNASRKKEKQKAVENVDFAKENWIKKNLKGMKAGAAPPLGILWKLPTFAEKSFLNNPKIIINGGDYKFSISVSGANFKKLLPDLTIGSFSEAKKKPKKKKKK